MARSGSIAPAHDDHGDRCSLPRAATIDRPIEVDNVSMALVNFESGALGNITTSALSPRQESVLRLDFERATVECTALYRYTNQHWRFSTFDNSPFGEDLQRWQTIERDTMGSHNEQLRLLLDSMDTNQRPLVSGAEARRIIEFIASLEINLPKTPTRE